MAASLSELKAAPQRPRRRGWRWLAVLLGLILVAVVTLVLGLAAVLWHADNRHGLPAFPSLSEQPDTSLHGTVAYFANSTGCIRLVAAAGQPSRNLLCLQQQVTRFLVTDSGEGAGGGTAGPAFAVTGADLLISAG